MFLCRPLHGARWAALLIACLEVNPCPGYSYYQEATGAPIPEALAAYLDGERVAP